MSAVGKAVRVGERVYENSVLSNQFCCKSKISLKKIKFINFFKKKHWGPLQKGLGATRVKSREGELVWASR